MRCSCEADTQSDYVEFSNFNVGLVDRKMSRLCGTKDKLTRKEIVSDGTFFRASFHSNELYDATGFEAVYQFRKIEGKILPICARSYEYTFSSAVNYVTYETFTRHH